MSFIVLLVACASVESSAPGSEPGAGSTETTGREGAAPAGSHASPQRPVSGERGHQVRGERPLGVPWATCDELGVVEERLASVQERLDQNEEALSPEERAVLTQAAGIVGAAREELIVKLGDRAALCP